jgi:hypothetical protein
MTRLIDDLLDVPARWRLVGARPRRRPSRSARLRAPGRRADVLSGHSATSASSAGGASFRSDPGGGGVPLSKPASVPSPNGRRPASIS